MTLEEAIQSVCSWFARGGFSFALTSARTIDETHFEIVLQQVVPMNKRRVFKVEPEEIADCWKVVEVV